MDAKVNSCSAATTQLMRAGGKRYRPNSLTMSPRAGRQVRYVYRNLRSYGVTAERARYVIWDLLFHGSLSTARLTFQSGDMGDGS